jgi:hypothetical protein
MLLCNSLSLVHVLLEAVFQIGILPLQLFILCLKIMNFFLKFRHLDILSVQCFLKFFPLFFSILCKLLSNQLHLSHLFSQSIDFCLCVSRLHQALPIYWLRCHNCFLVVHRSHLNSIIQILVSHCNLHLQLLYFLSQPLCIILVLLLQFFKHSFIILTILTGLLLQHLQLQLQLLHLFSQIILLTTLKEQLFNLAIFLF